LRIQDSGFEIREAGKRRDHAEERESGGLRVGERLIAMATRAIKGVGNGAWIAEEHQERSIKAV